MTLCIATGYQCNCQPDEGIFCPDYKPDGYVQCLMKAITDLRAPPSAEGWIHAELLRECPHCGGKAVHSEGIKGDQPWHYVECLSCAAMAEPDAWNRRAAPTVEGCAELLREAMLLLCDIDSVKAASLAVKIDAALAVPSWIDRTHIDAAAQEIRDCFARYGSGNYIPTHEEVEIIDLTLDNILIDLIEKELSSAPQQASGWIAGLPDKDGHYLYYSLGHGVAMGFFEASVWKDVWGWDGITGKEITHWMELPAAPDKASGKLREGE